MIMKASHFFSIWNENISNSLCQQKKQHDLVGVLHRGQGFVQRLMTFPIKTRPTYLKVIDWYMNYILIFFLLWVACVILC